MGFSHGKFGVSFPGESQLRQSRATQPTLHVGCFSTSIIHQTLTWPTGSLTCTQLLMQAITQGSVQTHVRESALKVDSGKKKIPYRAGESNLRQRRDSPMLYQLSYIPVPKDYVCVCVCVLDCTDLFILHTTDRLTSPSC